MDLSVQAGVKKTVKASLARTALRIAPAFGRLGLSLTPSLPSLPRPVDATDEEWSIVEAVAPFTMSWLVRVLALVQATDYVNVNEVEGAFVDAVFGKADQPWRWRWRL